VLHWLEPDALSRIRIRLAREKAQMALTDPPLAQAILDSGSAGCQPAVVGSLPTTAKPVATRLRLRITTELFGKLPKRTRWQRVLPRITDAAIRRRRSNFECAAKRVRIASADKP